MLLACLSLHLAAVWTQQERRRAEVRHDFEQLAFELEREAGLYTEALINLASFFEASDAVDRTEFAIAAHDRVRRLGGVASLQWVPIVTAEQRRQVVQAARADGIAEYSFREMGADGHLAIAAQREIYYPIFFAEPHEEHRRALGFDLGSRDLLHDMLQRARQQSRVAVSAPMTMRGESREATAYLSALFVDKHQGFVVSEVHLSDLVRAALRRDPAWAAGLNFRIRGSTNGPVIFGQRGSSAEDDWLLQVPLPVGDRAGVLEMTADLHPRERFGLPRSVLLLSLLLASAAALLGFLLLEREELNLRILRRDAIRQRQLAAAAQRLAASERMASLGGMVAGITHEVNTPLNVAMLALDNLALLIERLGDEPAPSAEREHLAAQIETVLGQLGGNLRRAAQLINDFKRVSADRHSSRASRIDCRDFLVSIANLMQPKLSAGGVNVRCDAASGLHLTTRPGNLSQVLVILIDNALTHAFADTAEPQITLRAVRRVDADIEISCEDNGGGIAPEHRGRVFDSFFTTRPDSGGTGLGLYLAASIVHNKLRGELRLDVTDNGSQFIIRLPADDETATDEDSDR